MSSQDTKRVKKKWLTDALPAPLVAQALERTQIAKYHTKAGHGFAAEDVNHFADRMQGKTAAVVGTSNEHNGADRIVDGWQVQSKYFQTATDTISAAFDPASGSYRYTGQVLEVPKDQYAACVDLMRERIARGQVPGHSNPADAEQTVRQGTVTYRQARNIARAGNIDSLYFDARTQAVTSTYVFAVSFVMTFAQRKWRGDDTCEAITEALGAALSGGGNTLITGIVGAQVLRTEAAAIGVVAVRTGVKALAGTAVGRATVHRIAAGSLGKAVYGAAAVNHVAKLLRSNAVTATIAAVVMTTPDFYRALFAQSISWRQFGKNLAVNVAGVVAGTAGWLAGAAVGASVGTTMMPFLGTAAGGVVGGIVGALVGGIGGSNAGQAFADRVCDDDAAPLISAMHDELQELAFEYLLTEAEVEQLADEAGRIIKPKWLRRLFKQTRHGTDEEKLRGLIRQAFEPAIESLVRKRPVVVLPQADEVGMQVIRLAKALATPGMDQAWSEPLPRAD